MWDRRWILMLALTTGVLVAHVSCTDDKSSGVGDCVPPAAVRDLRVLSVRDSTVLLAWTAPGDDGVDGTAAKYDVRFSIAPDTTDTWWDALTVPVENPWRPKMACGAESLCVNGVSPDSVYFFALRTADEALNWSDVSNVASSAGLVPPDTIPPESVADLRAVSVTDTSITLAWTAPGDDGGRGRATTYDLRYFTDPVDESSWARSATVDGLPRPRTAGEPETCTVSGLDPVTVYHFALKTTDEASNWSALSNGDSATTPAPVGTVHVVMADGTGDFRTIQAAAWAAVAGDTIVLGDGTYVGEGNRDVYCRSLTVRSASGDPERCIVDCAGSESEPHYGFLFDSWGNVESALEGISVTNGWGERGGAVYAFVPEGPTVTLRNCTFVGNRARYYGAAVFVAGEAVVELCSFLQNSSTWDGGGLYGGENSHMRVADCTFSDNLAVQRGGGVFCGGRAEFSRCTFTGNSKSGLYANIDSDVALTDCAFLGNRSWTAGGIYIDRARAVLANCVFSGNSAGTGGGMYSSGSTVTASGCIFSGNGATYPVSGGSGACVTGGSYKFINCTFVGNMGDHGAVIVGDAGVSFDHVIIAFNPGSALYCTTAYTSVPTFTCCDLFYNVRPDWVACIADQASKNGNFSLDPIFCNWAGGNYGLRNGESPCAPGGGCGLVGALGVGCQWP
jgi:hypothetical protein